MLYFSYNHFLYLYLALYSLFIYLSLYYITFNSINGLPGFVQRSHHNTYITYTTNHSSEKRPGGLLNEKFGNIDRMIWSGVGNARHSHVCIPSCLYAFAAELFGNLLLLCKGEEAFLRMFVNSVLYRFLRVTNHRAYNLVSNFI